MTDSWRTILSVGRLVSDLTMWAVPCTLVGDVVAVELLIIGLVAKRGLRR